MSPVRFYRLSSRANACLRRHERLPRGTLRCDSKIHPQQRQSEKCISAWSRLSSRHRLKELIGGHLGPLNLGHPVVHDLLDYLCQGAGEAADVYRAAAALAIGDLARLT
ncbi:MAG TPA: hypothetical protein HA366_02240 [Candidatus Methanomethylophilaceae archaeon]|nr:hypothetical protein [Candidatus Methanomethylophilaceae archaeon]